VAAEDVLDILKRGETVPIDPIGQASPQSVLLRVQRSQNNVTDEEFAAEFVGQKELGNPGAPSHLRSLISFLGDTPEEQKAAFSMFFPDGEILQVPATDITLFRLNKDEEFRKVDAGFFEAFGLGLTGFGKEMLGDVRDLGGESLEIAGETAGLFLGRRPGAGKVVSDMLRMALGAGVGEAVQQGVQTAVGTQRQDIHQQSGMVAGAAALSAVGNTIGLGIGAGVNTVLGRGVTFTAPEAQAAREAAARIETKGLLPSQASDVPAIRLLGRQAQALLPRIQRYLLEQEKRTAAAVRGLIDEEARNKFVGETFRAVTQASKDLVDLTIAATKIVKRSPRAGGRALQQGVERWWKTSGVDVDNLYKTDRCVEEPIFDIEKSGLLDTARTLKEGKLSKGQGEGEFIRVDQLQPEVSKFIDDILALDPTISRTNVSAFDQLQALRRRIDDFTLSGPAGPRLNQAIASDLKDGVIKAIENPVNESKEFVGLWKVANRAAASRFRAREKTAVVDLMKSQLPSESVGNLARPGQLDNLVAIRKTVPDKEWAKFEESVITQLLLDPVNLGKNLDAFDQPTLNLLMSPTRQRILRDTATEAAKLGSPKIQQALANQSRVRGFVKEIFDTKDTARISAFQDLVTRQGGRDGPLGSATQASIVNEIWERSSVVEQGVAKIDFNKMQSTLSDFEERGLLEFLKPKTIQVLRDAELVQDFARLGVKDAGTALQAAAAVADVRGGGVRGLITIVENYTVGKLITWKPVINFLLGTGRKRPLDTAFLKLIGGVLTGINSDLETQQELGDGFLRLSAGLGRGAGKSTESFMNFISGP